MDDPFPLDLIPAWQRLFSEPEHLTLDPASGVCEAVFRDGVLFPLQRKQELAKMLALARTINPKTILEIGCDKAPGLLHWCLLPGVERVIGCEIRGTPYAEPFERAFPHLKFLWLPASSYEQGTYGLVRHWLAGEPIDVLFLDGDKGVFLEDFDTYLPLMRSGGRVFLHDIQDPGPGDAFNRIRERGYETEVILDTYESVQALDSQDRGEPPSCAHESWLQFWQGRSCGVGVVHLGG